ncbi:peptidase S8/S53 subtilisin kexin sedolisin [Sporosarcina sp. PTS2304]|uniref:S8 family peptidase n=1 Tax=Sporosarcina sp. PTS2304 TaxID=2283194 RepID=UPI000E0DE879|nr:S8 family peptidase [Sporosarcina sp. PTS2304]AXH99749.1 peptidase S8/S53 subtilisin kexin sedolisin [Sporosarcina sp. PTS2304]
MKKLIVLFIASSLIVFGGFSSETKAEEITDKYIVYYADAEQVNAKRITELGGEVQHAYTYIPALLVNASAEEIEAIRSDASVMHVELDSKAQVVLPIRSPMERLVKSADQYMPWGVQRVQAPQMWQRGYTGKGVKVAVLDTGIALNHEDLTVSGGISYVPYTQSYADDHDHGTHVAGIIGAKDNSVGVVGVAPDAELYAVKVLDSDNSFITSNVIKGIEWSIANDMDILNMSLYTYNYYDDYGLHEVLKVAHNKGLLLVGITGNSGTDNRPNTVTYPGKYPEVIAVGATDASNWVSEFSSFGAEAEVSAPGEAIYSTLKDGTYEIMSGTSMAAPHVSGMLALMKEKYPNYSSTQLRNALKNNTKDLGVKGWDPYYGQGLIQGDLGHYKIWPAKQNVSDEKVWSITYNRPVDSESVIEENFYVTDSLGYRHDVFPMLVESNQMEYTIVQVHTWEPYQRGETYTLWIEDVRSEDGTKLKENVKMEFTIQQ